MLGFEGSSLAPEMGHSLSIHIQVNGNQVLMALRLLTGTGYPCCRPWRHIWISKKEKKEKAREKKGKEGKQEHNSTAPPAWTYMCVHVCFSNIYIQHQYNKRVNAKRESRLAERTMTICGIYALLESLKVLAWVFALGKGKHTQNQIHNQNLHVENPSKSQH